MQTMILEIDTAFHVKHLAGFLKTLPYIKSVVVEPLVPKAKSTKALAAADWVRPGRPATEEEIEELCRQMEEPQEEYSLEAAKAKTFKEIKEWRKRNAR